MTVAGEERMNDPLNEALKEATLAVLLGNQTVPTTQFDNQGNSVMGIATIPSAFIQRIQARASKGDFDSMIDTAMQKVTADDLVPLLAEALVKQMLAGLEPVKGYSYNDPSSPGWLSKQAKEIATEAATKALGADDSLMETLRQRIGMEVDRNRVGISVSLSDPEK